MFVIGVIPFFREQGKDSPNLKLYYLSFLLVIFQLEALKAEKTVIGELGES